MVADSWGKVLGGPELDPWEPLGPRAGGQREAAERRQDGAVTRRLGGWLEEGQDTRELAGGVVGEEGGRVRWVARSLGPWGVGAPG